MSSTIIKSELRGTLTIINQTIRDITKEFQSDEDLNPYILRTSAGEFPLIHLLQARSNVLLGLAMLESEKRARYVNRT